MKKTIDKIAEYIKENTFVTVSDISDEFGINRQMVHRHLKKLLELGLIIKNGKAPKVFYSASVDNTLVSKSVVRDAFSGLDEKTKRIIDDNFLLIEPTGQRKEALEGFLLWCGKRNFSFKNKAKEYIKVFEKYNDLKKDGFLDGTAKLSVFKDKCLDKLFYMDFYAWEVFGKTKLGQLLLYAKQSQDRKIIVELVDSIKPKIEDFITKKKIDAVGFIPPTIKREHQFMKILEERMNLSISVLNIIKIKTEIVVPQKTLSKLSDRIENAEKTIMLADKRIFKNILLLDDAVGSGATLNQTACKFKKRNLANKVIGLAITGSLKGFDVISEV
jgi:predicted amidophosphoribosyltransferase/DNA-binding transcriptional ArsR family regulator